MATFILVLQHYRYKSVVLMESLLVDNRKLKPNIIHVTVMLPLLTHFVRNSNHDIMSLANILIVGVA